MRDAVTVLEGRGICMSQNDDLISRQAAIEALVNKGQASTRYKLSESWELNYQEIREVLNALPPAQLDRKKGEWIQNDNGTYSCSLCHSWIPKEQYYYAQFCLYCGADMRGLTIGKVD